MATIGNTNPTLLDVVRRLAPDGKIAVIAELLNKSNPILDHMTWVEGNLPTGHKHNIRTGLPTVYWRLLNQGIPKSKSTTKAIVEAMGMCEAFSDVDVDLAKLNGNEKAFRLSEDIAFIEAMGQEMATKLFYGDSATDEAEFIGLSPRYSTISTDEDHSGFNIVNGGGSGADNASIWLVGWGKNACHGIFPKGSMAGLHSEDLGKRVVQDANSNNFLAYSNHYKWDVGLAVRDWRHVVRIANIDMSDLIANNANAADLINLMIDATGKLPASGDVRYAFYCNRTIQTILRKQVRSDTNVRLTVDTVAGKKITSFDGIPINRTDALLSSESAVS